METKQCSRCKKVQPLSAFHKNKGNKDGLSFQCKECRKIGGSLYYSKLSKEQKQKRNELKKQWADTNKEKVKKYSKQYADLHLANRAATQRKRLSAKLHRTPSWLTADDYLKIRCLYQVARMRTTETGYVWHVDHILPLQGKNVCGLHVPWNLQVIPATENLRKYNKHE